MPSYYVPGRNRCRSCNGLQNTTVYQRLTNAPSSQQTQILNSGAVYSTYNLMSKQRQDMGNLVKKGSGGNSYDSYLMRKKGILEDYCNCNN